MTEGGFVQGVSISRDAAAWRAIMPKTLRTITHEKVHAIIDLTPDGQTMKRRVLADWWQQIGEKARAEQRQKLADKGYVLDTMTPTAIAEEAFAHGMEDVNLIGPGGKLRMAFNAVMARVRFWLREEYGVAWKWTENDFREFWRRGVANLEKGADGEGKERGGVKLSRDNEEKTSLVELRDRVVRTPMVEAHSGVIPYAGKPSEIAKAVVQWWIANAPRKEVRLSANNQLVKIEPSGIKNALSHGIGPEKVAMVPVLDKLLENAAFVARDTNNMKPGVRSIETYANRVSVDGKNYIARLVVREVQDGRRFYDHELSGLRPDKAQGLAVNSRDFVSASAAVDSTRPLPSPGKTLLEKALAVNRDETPPGIIHLSRDKSVTADTADEKRGVGLLYSNTLKALDSWQGKGTLEQLQAHLARFKGAKEEGDWIGLGDWLRHRSEVGGQRTVTRDEVRQFVEQNRVDVREVVKGRVELSEADYATRPRGGRSCQRHRERDCDAGERERSCQRLVVGCQPGGMGFDVPSKLDKVSCDEAETTTCDRASQTCA